MVSACLKHLDIPLACFILFNHAFFKALLLAAGVVIHRFRRRTRDMRRMGGLMGIWLSYTVVLVPFPSGTTLFKAVLFRDVILG
jgi:NADH:ubiquinone oxidoreductase subunit 5 (subunit L)/multisubunit Na+/H+ antiporter MnhA subunit